MKKEEKWCRYMKNIIVNTQSCLLEYEKNKKELDAKMEKIRQSAIKDWDSYQPRITK